MQLNGIIDEWSSISFLSGERLEHVLDSNLDLNGEARTTKRLVMRINGNFRPSAFISRRLIPADSNGTSGAVGQP
jgi:hypothetical protein